jgi:hypothetical protein
MRAAWTLLAVCLVGWPLSVFWLAPEEPRFVLSLSWAALVIESVNVLSVQDVRKQQEDGGNGGN